MPFTLPKLNYSYSDLEPFIDAQTMEIHHTKHHQTYVNNLNKALENYPELAKTPLEELLKKLNDLPESVQMPVRNNGGGHFNHSLFWDFMSKDSSEADLGEVAQQINSTFGDMQKFKEEFTKVALARFGSGWAWLASDSENKLKIYSTANQDSPILTGDTPLLALDVWEHAYYLKYQNRRNEYIENWWNVVNWKKVAELYTGVEK